MPIVFENRIVHGANIQVVLYDDPLYRVDMSANARPYVHLESTAPYKFFTTAANEAEQGYSRRAQMLVTWQPSRPLVLVHMFDPATRNTVRRLVTPAVQNSLNHSFPVGNNGRVSRVSEEDRVHNDYAVTGAICELFSGAGIDGFYVPRTRQFHSEIAICNRTLRELGVMARLEMRRVAPENVRVGRRGAIDAPIEPAAGLYGALAFGDDDDDGEVAPLAMPAVRRLGTLAFGDDNNDALAPLSKRARYV